MFDRIRISSVLALALLVVPASWAGGETSADDDASRPFVVKIHADWCGTCTRMNPTFERLDADLGGSARIVVLDVTDRAAVTRSAAEAERLGIRDFFESYKAKTGTVGVLHGVTRETVTVVKGELYIGVYEAAVSRAAGRTS